MSERLGEPRPRARLPSRAVRMTCLAMLFGGVVVFLLIVVAGIVGEVATDTDTS